MAEMIRIQAADTPELLAAAGALVQRQYEAKGFGNHNVPTGENAWTIVALRDANVIGTLSLVFDGPEGLQADHSYRGYIDDRRAVGGRCVEVTKLAVDRRARGYPTLDAIFRAAVAIMEAANCTDVFAEAKPGHARVYEDRLRFWPVGQETTAARVNAPARLMWNDLQRLVQAIKAK